MLAEHQVDYERRDYFKQKFTVEELRSLLDEIGLKPSDVLSKRSKAYRDLGLAERDLTEEELLNLIPENPTLLRRPLIVKDGEVVIGFNEEKIEALIEDT